MFNSEYLLLKLFDGVGKIEGRKKLQKTVHLLSFTGADVPFKFHYHHYGPYSSELQGEIDRLVQHGFIEEKIVNGTYVYEITEKGRAFKRQLDRHLSQEIDTGLVDDLNRCNSQFLEMVSTYAFLIDYGYSPNEALEKAKSLKPHLESFAADAQKYFHTRIKAACH